MAIYHRNMIVPLYEYALTQEREGDMALCFVAREKDFGWLSVRDCLSQQMEWRKLAQTRKLKISKFNNKEATDDKGNKWYFFVVQPYKNGKIAECNMDLFGLFVLGEAVSGYIYAFRKKEDRDGIYQAVMAFIPQPTVIDGEESEEFVVLEKEPTVKVSFGAFCGEHSFGPIDVWYDCQQCLDKEVEDNKKGEGRCCLCEGRYTNWGNNPQPLNDNPQKRCCDLCNTSKVLPARMCLFKQGKNPRGENAPRMTFTSEDVEYLQEAISKASKEKFPDLFELGKKTKQKKEKAKKMTPEEKDNHRRKQAEEQKRKQAELDALCVNIGDIPLETETASEKPKTKKQLDAERTREANRIKKEELKEKQKWEHRSAEIDLKKYEQRVAKQQEIERKKAKAKSVQGM